MTVPLGQNKLVCIVYCDIVHSTQAGVLARRIGRESAHQALLSRFHALWRAALQFGEARFIKSLGDGLLATFPNGLSALRAVIQAQKALNADANCKTLPVRVGLHIGDVSEQPDGDIGGPDASLGQRVMSEAQAGEIVVSAAYADQVRPYLPADYRLQDLGERPLKGFDTPLRLYRLYTPDQLETLTSPEEAVQCGNLPAAPDRFFGRKREIADLCRFFKDTTLRCLTLVGTAGCGKTRLALEAGARARALFPGGVYFISLEEAMEAGDILTRIARTLSIAISPNADILNRIQTTLATRCTLLLLDNFEQAREAANTVAALLDRLPELHILVTSREPLQLRCERVYDLDPLDVPPANASYRTIRASASIRMFVDRAQARNRQFQLSTANAEEIAALCRALSGLPLALELLAAEVRYRSLSRLTEIGAELLDVQSRIHAVPNRQRSLRAAFDWSYEQLSAEDQQLFAQLGLFETCFDEEEVYDICTGADLGEGLWRLQAKSLVYDARREGDRHFRLLVPVREYARARLDKPTGALRRRFIAFFTRRAQTLRDAYRRYNAEPEALGGLQADLDNFRLAWKFACEDGIPEVIADLGTAVAFFAPLMPRATNLEGWLEATEQALRRLHDTCRLGKLWNTRARLASTRGDFQEAVRYQQEALRCLMEAGEPADIADAHSTLAFFALRFHDYAMAEDHAWQGIEGARQGTEAGPEAVALFVLASVLTPGDLTKATDMAERSLRLFQTQGQRRGMAHAHTALAAIAEAHGDMATAEARYRDALRLCWERQELVQVARCLEAIAKFYARCGNQVLAAELLAAAATEQSALGMPQTARLALPEADPPAAADKQPTLALAVEHLLSAPSALL